MHKNDTIIYKRDNSMQSEINIKLLRSLPNDVVINHIIPYTYQHQPKHLLRDIRSFYTDIMILENSYSYDYNYDVLLYDLTCFCNRTRFPNYTMHKDFGNLLRRSFMLQDNNYIDLNNMVFIHFYRDILINPVRKIRFLWGLLKPKERLRFIEIYLLENFHS